MSQISLYKILNKIFFVTFIFLNLQNISSAYEQVQIDYPDKSANQPAQPLHIILKVQIQKH